MSDCLRVKSAIREKYSFLECRVAFNMVLQPSLCEFPTRLRWIDRSGVATLDLLPFRQTLPNFCIQFVSAFLRMIVFCLRKSLLRIVGVKQGDSPLLFVFLFGSRIANATLGDG